MSLAFVFLVSLGMLRPPTSDEAELQVRPPKGHSARYEVEHVIENETNALAMSFTVKISLHQVIELVAKGQNDEGLHQVDLEFHHVRGSIEGPMVGSVQFDSEKEWIPTSELFDSKTRQLVMRAGKTVHLLVHPDGTVKSVSGYEEIYEGTDLGEKLAKDGDLLTNESFRDDAQVYFARMPAKKVEEGSRWKAPYRMSVFLQEMDLQPSWELDELTKNKATATFLGKYSLEEGGPEPKPIEAGQDMALLVKRSSIKSASLQGRYVMDRKTGLLIEASVERVVGAETPNPFGGKGIPSVVLQKTSIKKIKSPEE